MKQKKKNKSKFYNIGEWWGILMLILWIITLTLIPIWLIKLLFRGIF